MDTPIAVNSKPLAPPLTSGTLSHRTYAQALPATSWKEIWEAGSYYERISELLEQATSYAIFLGWQIDSRLPLPHGSARESLKAKLIRLCEEKPDFQVYILMWDHAYFYVFEREIMQGRVWDEIHPRVHFIFDNRHPFGASHHEKLCIIDGKTGFCGGIDLCDERWDSPQHLYHDPRRSLDLKMEHHGPYHDMAVEVQGPICAALQKHAYRRWRQLSSIPFPFAPLPPEETPDGALVYLSRTLAGIDVGRRPALIREIEFLFRELIQMAQHRIIIEGQYYWSKEVNELLIAKMRERQGQDFTVILVLAELRGIKSLTRFMVRYEFTLLGKLKAAAEETGTRLVMGSPYCYPPEDAPRSDQPKPIYIHSKMLIVDDRFVSIGSANFAARALRIDSEVNLTLEARTDSERKQVRSLIDQFYRHWSAGPYENQSAPIRLRNLADPPLGSPVQGAITRLLNQVPWERLLDPEMPWTYALKRRIRVITHRKPRWIPILAILLWLTGVGVSLIITSLLSPSQITSWDGSAWPWIYATLLSSAWLIRVPFTGVALLASLHLGPEVGPALAVATTWVISTIGYGLTRTFPAAAGHYFRRTAPRWLPKEIALRSFPVLLSILLNPRLSLRTKIAFQGLYTVPGPWFILGTWIILPSLIYTSCRWAAFLLEGSLQPWIHAGAPALVGIIAVLSLTDAVNRIRNG